MPSLDWEIG